MDGVVEPDRWLIDRPPASGPPSSFVVPLVYRPDGEPFPARSPGRPGLFATFECGAGLGGVRAALQAEAAFGAPQDVEWTCQNGIWYMLQSRPITTVAADDQDQRPCISACAAALKISRSCANAWKTNCSRP